MEHSSVAKHFETELLHSKTALFDVYQHEVPETGKEKHILH
jgi:hypothetical protein